MANYGIKVAKQGFDVADAAEKDLIFTSKAACMKFLQVGKVSAVSSSEITFNANIAFPIDVYVFLYDSDDSYYHPIDAEFNTTKLFLTGGEASGSYYYYFICYG